MVEEGRATAPVLPEELVLWEILVGLPAKELLRCRVVCRSWHRLTSAADFLLAHHRHQPSLPLLDFEGEALTPWSGRELVDAGLDALDLRRSPVERRPVLRFDDYNQNRPHGVYASCGGLLVVSLRTDRFFYICNPTTRQWITLPDLPRCFALGLYPHISSGEYRILYCTGGTVDKIIPSAMFSPWVPPPGVFGSIRQVDECSYT